MPQLAMEWEHLAKAERGIVAGERHVTAQISRVERLENVGRDTREAEQLLRNLQQMLEVWWRHRDAILCEIDRLEHASPRQSYRLFPATPLAAM